MENLRISTMTAVSKIAGEIDLSNIFEMLNVNDDVKFIQYKEKDKGITTTKKKRKNNPKKTFYNQVTLHVFYDKIVNVKIFNNGKIQMTGLKSEEMGNHIIRIVKDNIKNLELIEIYNENDFYKTVLINSDFDIKYKVDREKLHDYMIDSGIYSSYEPCFYPGVNIKYYYNSLYDNGICLCENRCNGKGIGDGDGLCKKITIAVFNSGKIIITGGQSFNQIETAYEFIFNILSKERNLFEIK